MRVVVGYQGRVVITSGIMARMRNDPSVMFYMLPTLSVPASKRTRDAFDNNKGEGKKGAKGKGKLNASVDEQFTRLEAVCKIIHPSSGLSLHAAAAASRSSPSSKLFMFVSSGTCLDKQGLPS